MKYKYARCFPLSLALSALPLVSSAQDAEPPVQGEIEESAPKTGSEMPEVTAQAIVDPVGEAKLRLEEARLEAETATGDAKVAALAKVENAEKLLGAAVESERKSAGEATGLMPEVTDPNSPAEITKAPVPAGEDTANDNGSARRARPARPDPSSKTPAPADVAAPPAEAEPSAAVEAPKPTATEAPVEAQIAEPETQPEAEAIVETKEEVKEAVEADQAVDLTTEKVEKEADRRKLNIKDKGAARDLIRDLIGSESQVSRAEAARETRLQPRVQGNDRRVRGGGNREEISTASAFLLRQLNGQAPPEEQAPKFFRRSAEFIPEQRGEAPRGRNLPPVVRERELPRYFHEGRRYVRYDSRNSVPAILLAAAALERVEVIPAERTEGYFPPNRGEDRYANELPPENFRGEDAVVVSYPVSKSSMISSNDIIFAQGSTRFADGHSYDMVMALADAMANPALKDARFVIEGHASAEGSYEANMALSQRRAEAIVRDMVREGIDPERLIPVGYGESEARYPADANDRLRSLDRNVRVFRTGGEQ